MMVPPIPAISSSLVDTRLPLRVLFIEDSPHDALLIEHALRQGIQVIESVRVDTLVDLDVALKWQSWDLILADYTLPGFTALDALTVVHAYGQDVPFLVVSGTLDAAAAVAVMHAGAHDYMGKNDLARLIPAVTREIHEASRRRSQREAEVRLQASEERFQAQYQGSPVPTLIWQLIDDDFELIDVNLAALDFTQDRIHGFLGHRASVIYHEDAQTLANLARCYADQTVVYRELWWTLGMTDEPYYVAESYAPVPPDLVMLHFVDLTARKRTEEALDQENRRLVRDTRDQMLARRQSDQAVMELRTVNEQLVLSGLREQEMTLTAMHRALHDSLTGLANRVLFLDRIEQAIQIQQRGAVSFAVLLVDLDHFKLVNDTLGHLVGDHFLQEIARRLSSCVRPKDMVARLGGDEFALLLEAITEVSEVIHIAERIHECLNAPIIVEGQRSASSASIGIVVTASDYSQTNELLHDADTALYRAKALGAGNFVIFDPIMNEQALALTNLETELRHAITYEEFTLHYQPIVSLHSGLIIGVEALVRWQHPVRGCLMPGEFLTVVETSGLIIQVGSWVLRTACAQMKTWHEAGFPTLFLAVNLSVRQLQQDDLVEMVARSMEYSGLASGQLHLELTESSIMTDVMRSIATFEQLTALGVRVSVDDFGTGYSSLSYLKRLPLATVKVDRSFVDEVDSNADDAAITAAIIAMAHRMKLQVVAEGVETEAQLAYLRAEDCDAIQGYLISKPVPAADIAQLFSQTFLADEVVPLAPTGDAVAIPFIRER